MKVLRHIVQGLLGGKVRHLKGEYQRMLRVFDQAGGSWEGVVNGSVEDILLLKKVVVVAFKNGYLSKKEAS